MLAVYSCGGSCRLNSRGNCPSQSDTTFPFHPFARDRRLDRQYYKILIPKKARQDN
ncbi:hypothetical protein MSKU15_2009 [Komagataeibacter diospyri]|nr:hypothetical protein MSKU15_2009 [Komagataeibacter diospyri]